MKKHLIKQFNDNIDRSHYTEYELAVELGYMRIWDCGTKTYTKHYDA